MYKPDLALNNLQGLICYKNQPITNQPITNQPHYFCDLKVDRDRRIGHPRTNTPVVIHAPSNINIVTLPSFSSSEGC